MVSNARDDFPLPERPVMTTSLFLGISRLIFFKLWTRAPRMTILSDMHLSFPRKRESSYRLYDGSRIKSGTAAKQPLSEVKNRDNCPTLGSRGVILSAEALAKAGN